MGDPEDFSFEVILSPGRRDSVFLAQCFVDRLAVHPRRRIHGRQRIAGRFLRKQG